LGAAPTGGGRGAAGGGPDIIRVSPSVPKGGGAEGGGLKAGSGSKRVSTSMSSGARP
jgi:hypothetical protein